MRHPRFRGAVPLAVAALAAIVAACGGAARSAQSSARSPTQLSPAEVARADSGRSPYTRADVNFMTGMIGHHAQAVLMASWAPTHGANESVRVLASRIDVAQRDEIVFMQRWLRERHEIVPDADPVKPMAGHDMTSMPGMDIGLAPGMLTPDQMKQLDAARGREFDRLFLTFMIQHHTGALSMVNTLYASQGAANELYVFRFASDVEADQTTEIDRMQKMLAPIISKDPQ
jgi:uncharacterized protein (DUF305 family)